MKLLQFIYLPLYFFLLVSCTEYHEFPIEIDPMDPVLDLNCTVWPEDSVVYVSLYQTSNPKYTQLFSPAQLALNEENLGGYTPAYPWQEGPVLEDYLKKICKDRLYLLPEYQDDYYDIDFYENCLCTETLLDQGQINIDCTPTKYSISDANIQLTGNSQTIGDFISLEERFGAYKLPLTETLNNYNQLTINASAEGFAPITSTVEMITPVEITKVDMTYLENDQIQFTVHWDDKGQDGVFLNLLCKMGRDGKYKYYRDLLIKDPFIGNDTMEDDELIDRGPSFSFEDWFVPNVFTNNYNGHKVSSITFIIDVSIERITYEEVPTQKSFKFQLCTMSKSAYQRQLEIDELTRDELNINPISDYKQPSNLYSNIENGVGYFGIMFKRESKPIEWELQ